MRGKGLGSGGLLHQEDELDLGFSGQLSEAVRSRNMVVMGDLNYPDICWEDQSARTNHSRMFLICIQDLHLMPEVYDPTRGNTLLDLVLATGDDLVGELQVQGNLGAKCGRIPSLSLPKLFCLTV